MLSCSRHPSPRYPRRHSPRAARRSPVRRWEPGRWRKTRSRRRSLTSRRWSRVWTESRHFLQSKQPHSLSMYRANSSPERLHDSRASGRSCSDAIFTQSFGKRHRAGRQNQLPFQVKSSVWIITIRPLAIPCGWGRLSRPSLRVPIPFWIFPLYPWPGWPKSRWG